MKFKKTTLPNGLRVIVVPMKDNPSTTTMIMVEAGSNYETKEQNGLSHFLEHMCFKGTTHRPTALEIAREFDSMGAYNNAFTGSEYTGYYAKAENRHFKKIIEILSDMYLNPLFPKDDLEKERGVIIEEIDMYEDKPDVNVWTKLGALMYGDTPAGRPVIGPKENIKRFTLEDFVEYRKKHYVAGKTIVVVAGDVTEKLVLDEVKKHFKNIPQSKRSGKLPVRPKQKTPNLIVEKKKTNQTHMVLGFHAYDAKDKRLPALAVLSSILGGGMSGRLWRKVRHELGACYYVYSAIEENTDHGALIIATGINVSRVEEVLKAILSEVKDLRENRVLDDELSKAKEYYIGHLYMGLETTHKLTEFYGIGEVTSGKPQTPFDIEKQIRAVTAADVQKVAKDIFKDENLNLAIVGNLSDTKPIKKVLSFK